MGCTTSKNKLLQLFVHLQPLPTIANHSQPSLTFPVTVGISSASRTYIKLNSSYIFFPSSCLSASCTLFFCFLLVWSFGRLLDCRRWLSPLRSLPRKFSIAPDRLRIADAIAISRYSHYFVPQAWKLRTQNYRNSVKGDYLNSATIHVVPKWLLGWWYK